MSSIDNGGDGGSSNEDHWDDFVREADADEEELALSIALQCSRVDAGDSFGSAPSPVDTGPLVIELRIGNRPKQLRFVSWARP